jgi:hypothetical protein
MEVMGPGETAERLALELGVYHCPSYILVNFLSSGVVCLLLDDFESFGDVVMDKVGMKGLNVIFDVLVIGGAKVPVNWGCKGGERSVEEARKSDVNVHSTMVGVYTLVKRFNACSEEVGTKPLGDKDIIDAVLASSIGRRFISEAVAGGMAVNEVTGSED